MGFFFFSFSLSRPKGLHRHLAHKYTNFVLILWSKKKKDEEIQIFFGACVCECVWGLNKETRQLSSKDKKC